MQTTSPFADFSSACSAVLKMLQQRFGYSLWMVTRTEGENWIVLKAEGDAYNVADGQVFRWADSFCSRMVLGKGPRIAPRSEDVPAYAEAPIGKELPIRSYIGVPLMKPGGELFGTLCAMDPLPKSAEMEKELPLIELLARLLSSMLASDLAQQEATRRAERAEIDSMLDELTGLFNRRAWEKFLAVEDPRCHRYGHAAAVLSIDVDGLKRINDTLGHAAGDALLKRVAAAITSAARVSDIAARVGGDEFAILSVECDPTGAEQLIARLRDAFVRENVSASIGSCGRYDAGDLYKACKEADRDMYANKATSRDPRLQVI